MVAHCRKEQHQFAKSVDVKQCKEDNKIACWKHRVRTCTCTNFAFCSKFYTGRSHSVHSRCMARRIGRTRAGHCPTREQTATTGSEQVWVLLWLVSDLLPLAQKLVAKCWRKFGAGIVEPTLERNCRIPHVSTQQRLGTLGVAICCCCRRNGAVTLMM